MNHHPAAIQQLFGDTDPQDILRRCGRTFHAASRVLPPGVRRDLAVLYAFCRVVDDCADLTSTTSPTEHFAQSLLDEIVAGLDGRSQRSPIVLAFRELAAARGVPLTLAFELIRGVRSDLGSVRIASEGELVRYAFRVASTVGLMMCRILGVREEGDPFAIDLGIGMQLTNIARDVAEDAANNRVYIPAEWIPSADLIKAANGCGDDRQASAAITAVQRTLTLADQYYESAELGMHFLPSRVRGGIRAAAWNYRAIGTHVRREPERALRRRAHTTGLGKAFRTAAALWTSSLESLPLGPADTHDPQLHTPLASLRSARLAPVVH